MHKARGFTLIEIVVVLAIVSLLLAMAALATRAIMIQQHISTTATRLAGVDAALLQFVMVQKRLPCPADGTLDSANVNAGLEQPASRSAAAGCTTNQQNGVVPWRTLGISETDATDGWVRRLTYRVYPTLAGDSAMDMSGCDPAGSAGNAGGSLGLCVAGCVATTVANCTSPFNFLTNKGFVVQNIAGTRLMDPAAALPAAPTGAAYVVISHGESGGGAYLSSGQLATSTTTDGTEESKNYANVGVVLGTTYYVEDTLSDVPGATHFDDILSHPTILAVINKAALAPRSH